MYNTDVVYNNVVVYNNNNNCLEKFRLGRVRSKKNSWTLFVIYYLKGEGVEIIAEDGPYVVLLIPFSLVSIFFLRSRINLSAFEMAWQMQLCKVKI